MGTDSGSMQLSCLQCGASNASDSRECWVCHAPLAWEADTSIRAVKVPPALPRDRGTSYLTTTLLVVGVVATMIGLWKEAPGLAILLAVVFAPGLLLTMASSGLRKQQGRPMTGGDKVVRFLYSVAMTIGVLFVLGLVAVVSFVVWLFVVCAGGNFH